jgi:probable rRNA maturation factor
VNINIYNDQNSLSIDTQKVEKIVNQFLLIEEQSADEVSIHFVSTEDISKLHLTYFDDPSTTDCISFPIDLKSTSGSYRVLGDVFVCPETAIEYALKHHENPYEEVTLYIIHGLLHLLGYDDIDEADRILMRQAEAKHMEHLKCKKLILT